MIVGLCGPQFAGKSSVAYAAARIMQDRKKTARVVSFAQPMRDMMMALFLASGMDPDDAVVALTTSEGKETPLPLLSGRTPRQALQRLGTEWGRDQIDPALWINILLANISTYPADLIVIDDVRLETEVDAVRDVGGKIVEISRIGTNYSEVHGTSTRPAFLRGEPIPLYNGTYIWPVANTLLLKIGME